MDRNGVAGWDQQPGRVAAHRSAKNLSLLYAGATPAPGLALWVAPRWHGMTRVLAFLPLAIATVGVLLLLPHLQNLEDLGYFGVFIASVLSSATFVVPVPGVAVTMVAAVQLEPWLVGLVAASGSTLGELGAYLSGAGSRSMMDRMMTRHRLYPRIKASVARHGTLTLFALAAIPNPLFDVAGFAAASLGYPVRSFIIVCWLGKAVKFLVAAMAGAWALPALLRFFNLYL